MNLPELPKEFSNPIKIEEALSAKPERYWVRRGEKRVLLLFHLMSERVPAYKDFLKKQAIDPTTIKTIKDFSKLPTLTKDNYLKAYPLSELCWGGDLIHKQWTFFATSGSTGEPFYFASGKAQTKNYAAIAELYLRNNFQIHNRSTLYINTFALGVWIGGLFTYSAIKEVAERGNYALSIVNPGINKEEIFKVIRRFENTFDQIVIGGYPPFVKDILDEGERQGVAWGKHNLRFIFSAEGFSEDFRDYVAEKAHLRNIYTDTLNHYGTVDLGTMSHETPLAILVRRLAIKNKELYRDLFNEISKLPTLTQYIPELFFFEMAHDSVVCSSFGGIPLVRYDLKDSGGILSFNDVAALFQQKGMDLATEAKRAGIFDTLQHLPFVYVYERKDFSVSLYGGNIYPEHIRMALTQRTCASKVTGKFTITVKHTRLQNPYLEINIELQKNIEPTATLRHLLQETIVATLLKYNSEYQSNYSRVGKKVIPKIVFWEYGHPKYFSGKGKQKWTEK